MPNIEIHGFACQSVIGKQPEQEVLLLVNRIFDLFCDKPYVSEMVVTGVADNVWDHNRERQPFLRIVSSCQKHINEIIEILKTLNMDIEVQQLTSFHPKCN